MIKNTYELEVLVNGKSLPEYFHDYKTYIEGKKDSVFTVRLRNNSGENVLFVPTVDGLSVLDGKDGSYNSGGYIVNAYSSAIIDGWRLSDNKVAEFYFSSPENSYRKRKNQGNNLGCIGVAVFRKKQNPIVNHVFYHDTSGYSSGGFSPQSMNSSLTTSSASLRSADQELGTGFGKEVKSEVTKVLFERETSPITILEIFYNSRRALEEIGIEFRHPMLMVKTSSFPGEQGYCERP